MLDAVNTALNVLENIIVITRYYPAVFCSVMLLAGCSTHLPDVNAVKSQLALPAKWRNALPEGKDIKQTQHWWRSFQDPDLDALVERVLRNNNNSGSGCIQGQKGRGTSGYCQDEFNTRCIKWIQTEQ